MACGKLQGPLGWNPGFLPDHMSVPHLPGMMLVCSRARTSVAPAEWPACLGGSSLMPCRRPQFGGLGSGVLESWGLVAAVDLVGQLFLRISHWPLGSELKGRVQGTLHGVFHM